MTGQAALGLLAIVLYLPHAIWHVSHGSPWDLLWACNAAMPALAIGCFAGSGRLSACAFMILTFGTPMWLVDLASGANMVPTSPLVHVGGLAVGALAVRRLGWPRWSCLWAGAGAALLLGVTRLVSPSGPNVNLAFSVHRGWESRFPSHALFVVLLWASALGVFFVIERIALRWLGSANLRGA